MPQYCNEQVFELAKQGNRNHKHIHGPSQSNTNPLSPYNEPQAPSLPTVTSTPSSPQRQRNSFEYNSPDTIPYWDDSSGTIYEVPNIPPRHPGRTYAEVVNGAPFPRNASEDHVELERGKPVPRNFDSSGLTLNLRQDVLQHPTLQEKRSQTDMNYEGRRVDFTPWSDATEHRYEADLSKNTASSQKSSSRPALSAKDVNQKLRQGLEEKTKEHSGSSMGAANPSLTTMAKLRPSPASKVKSEAIFEVPGTGARASRPMSTLVEEPAPLRIPKKKAASPTADRYPSSPTLDRVRKLREIEQKAMLTKLDGQLTGTKVTKSHVDEDDIDVFAPDYTISHSKSSKKAMSPSKPEDLVLDVELSGSEWATPLYALVNPLDIPPQSPTRNLGLNPRRSSLVATLPFVDDVDECVPEDDNGLLEAMTDMRVFETLPSSPPEYHSFQRDSAIPEGLDLEKIQAAKQRLKQGSIDAPMEDTKVEGMNAISSKRAKSLKSKLKLSTESLETIESDDFERVASLGNDDTEHNGTRRKWYKGFRR
ncbi:Nn.00g075790.m01.CDS01 [Neocucurbitaria sp. VM-36]